MLEVFRHKTNDIYYYTRYSNELDGEHAHANWRYFFQFIKGKDKVHYITEYYGNINLTDRDFISLMAEYANEYQDSIKDSYIFGFSRIYRFFWKTFLSISKTSFQRKVVKTIDDVENHFGFSFEEDFVKVYEYPN
jgi:hypothetical protein